MVVFNNKAKKLMKQLTALIVMPIMMLTLAGCDLALFDSKGQVGESIASTMIYTVLLMLIVVIPTIFLSIYVPYKFRAGNKNAEYKPEWSHSSLIEAIVWGIPIVIILFLAVETYKTSFSLNPHKPIQLVDNPQEQPLKIQVVALDWKWLFIYPEEGIATVNEIAVPVDKPVQFLLTSDGAINSFFIPRLGSQLYAMAGMESQLNLIANEPGVFKGISSNYSGFGFTGMRFNVRSMNDADYEGWVAKVKSSGKKLDDATYSQLAKKSRENPVEYFVNTNPLRFKKIIDDNTGLNAAKERLKANKHAHGHDSHEDEKHEEHKHNDHHEHEEHNHE